MANGRVGYGYRGAGKGIRDRRAEIEKLKCQLAEQGENKKLQLRLKELQYFYL